MIGAAVFGIGWGLVGFCLDPTTTTALVSGVNGSLIFYVSMIAGMYVFGTLDVIGCMESDGGVSGIDYFFKPKP